MTGDQSTRDGTTQEECPDRHSLLALARGMRTVLRFHAQIGIARYPRTPAVQRFLSPNSGRTARCSPQDVVPVAPVVAPAPDQVHPHAKSTEGPVQLGALGQEIAACQSCVLASMRQGQVSGRGMAGVSLLVVGDFSRQPEGFSGETLFGTEEDTMLWNMMRAIGLTPNEVFVTNAIKCCPLAAVQPETGSALCCRSFLLREIGLVRPDVICAMGDVAAQAVLGGKASSVFRLRGKVHQWRAVGEPGVSLPVLVTFHPRFLLQHEELKKTAWQDLQMLQRELAASGRNRS